MIAGCTYDFIIVMMGVQIEKRRNKIDSAVIASSTKLIAWGDVPMKVIPVRKNACHLKRKKVAMKSVHLQRVNHPGGSVQNRRRRSP